MASTLGLIDRETQLQRSLKAKAARETAKQAQKDQTVEVDGFQVRPASGYTGGAPNLGWELIPPKTGRGPVWYLATKELALAAVPRHRSAYGG